MDSELDPFGDILPGSQPALNRGRAGGKFQPKAKAKARNVTSALISPMVPTIAEDEDVKTSSNGLDTMKSFEAFGVVDDRLTNVAVSSSVTVALTEDEEILKDIAENVKFELGGSSPSALPLLTKEAGSSGNDLESFVPETVVGNEKTAGEFKLQAECQSEEDDSSASGLHKQLTERVATEEAVSSKHAKLTEAMTKSSCDRQSGFRGFVVEVESLGLDLDPFSDVVSNPVTSTARAGGKFQPRAKVQPRMRTSIAAASVVPDTAAEKVAILDSAISDNMEFAKSIDVGDDALLSGISIGDPNSASGKPVGENADIFLGLECIHDFVTQSTSGTEILAPASDKEADGKSYLAGQNAVNSAAFNVYNDVAINPVTCEEAAIQTKDGSLEPEESGAFPCSESADIFLDSIVAPDNHSRKLEPLQESQNINEEPSTSILPPDAVQPVVPPQNPQFAPSEAMYIDDVLDYSSMSFSDFTTSEFPINEEQSNVAQASCKIDANVVFSENVPEDSENEISKSEKRKASLVSNLSGKSKSSPVGEMNEEKKSSRQLRKRAAPRQLVDEPEDETCDSGSFPANPLSSSVVDEEDNEYEYRDNEDNDKYRGETTSQKKRASNRSNKPAAEKEKPARKRKRANDAIDQSTQKPPKKFSHSTRRKKRLQELLKIPEDEIDYRRLACRDIILLAGYKEQLAIKEAKALKTSVNNKSTNSSFRAENTNNDEDSVASDQDIGDADDQRNSRTQTNFPLFNSQSFMDKTPRVRWSKLDTELFYEGVRQFGTDLSMIQQLFPGRTRHQIKLKWKKEERQQPFRLHEALGTRAKDHSYFEKVIEQLQQVAAQADDQDFVREDSAGLTGKDEAELYSETNEEVEDVENVGVEEQETNTAEVESPVKYDGNEDDLDIWSSYRSEF